MDLDKREFYYEKFKKAMWEGFTPDDYLEYYDYIKERAKKIHLSDLLFNT